MGFVGKTFDTDLTPREIGGLLFTLGVIDLALLTDPEEGSVRLGTGNNHWLNVDDGGVFLASRYDNPDHDRLVDAIEVIVTDGA